MPSKAESAAAMEVYKPVEPTGLATAETLPTFEAIVQSVSGGQLSPDDVTKLLTVYTQLKADRAKQEYNVAFAAFQSECPPVSRNRKADVATDKGGRYSYDFADVENIMRTVGPFLAAHGLSVSFENSEVNGNMLTETCRCAHVGGHSQTSSFDVTLESRAGMSPQQKYGAASTYAMRRALSKVLGIWTGDPDTDGGDPEPAEPLTAEQQKRITDLVTETGTDWGKFLGWWGVPNFADARQDKYRAAVRFLEARRLSQRSEGT